MRRQQRAVVEVDDHRPLGAEVPAGMGDQGAEQRFVGLGADQEGGGLEGVEAGVGELGRRRPHVLHVDAVDLVDLGQEQGDQAGVGELHDQLVDGPAGAALEDVDAHHVAPDRADAAGHLAEGSRAVGHPDADDKGLHGVKATRQT